MKKYWEKGISFEEYFKKTEEIVNKDEEKLTPAEKEMLEYYKLGVQRMSRMMKVYKPNEEQAKFLENKNFDYFRRLVWRCRADSASGFSVFQREK